MENGIFLCGCDLPGGQVQRYAPQDVYKRQAEDRMKQIVDYLTEHRSAKASEIADHIGLQPSRTRDYLTELVYAGIVITEGKNRNRVYRLNR